MAERGQDVVGSYGRCHVPNNHSKYRTSGVPAFTGTPVKLQHEHGRPGIEPPDPLAGKPIDRGAAHGKECPHSPRRIAGLDARKHDAPLRRLEPKTARTSLIGSFRLSRHRARLASRPRAARAGQLEYLDHVNPVRQRCVKPPTDVVRLATAGNRELEVFRLAR